MAKQKQIEPYTLQGISLELTETIQDLFPSLKTPEGSDISALIETDINKIKMNIILPLNMFFNLVNQRFGRC